MVQYLNFPIAKKKLKLRKQTNLCMRSAVLRRGLPERAVHRARGVLRVLVRLVRQVVRVRVRVRVRMRRVRVRRVRVPVRDARLVPGAQVACAPMVLRQRERRARRPPVPPLLHVRPGGASRRAAARAAPGQRMPARLVRAPVVTLPPRHPFRYSRPLLASPPRPRHTAGHPFINHLNNLSCTRVYHLIRNCYCLRVLLNSFEHSQDSITFHHLNHSRPLRNFKP